MLYKTKSPQETEHLGEKISGLLRSGDIVAFEGELGAGKTCLIKGIASGLGITENITSSSFVLMRPFNAKFPVYHFDLYRLCSKEELIDIGYEEFIFSEAISLIEWAEKMGDWIGDTYLLIKIKYDDEDVQCRDISLECFGKRYDNFINELDDEL